MGHLDEAIPTDAAGDATLGAIAGDLTVLRARLGAVEAAVGRPGPLGAPAPPTLPALARRIATLERQAGIVPGLDLLAGPPAAAMSRPARALPAPPTRGQVWRERGQAALAAMLLLAVFTWLLRPTVPREGAAAPTTPAANVLTPPAPVAAPPATPMALASETPLRRAAPAVPDYNSDLGTEFDPFVIQNSRLRYTPAPGTTWTVEFVAAPPPCDWEAPAPTCAPAFAPALLVIQAGDTVVWQVRDGRHTVTFPASGTPAPPLYLAWLGEATGELNPLAAEPQGNTVYDGTALVGSGVLDENASTYRLTFPQPGHYVYVDLEHPGLLGEIIVLSPADEPVR